MHEKTITRIFTRFFTTKAGPGSGRSAVFSWQPHRGSSDRGERKAIYDRLAGAHMAGLRSGAGAWIGVVLGNPVQASVAESRAVSPVLAICTPEHMPPVP